MDGCPTAHARTAEVRDREAPLSSLGAAWSRHTVCIPELHLGSVWACTSDPYRNACRECLNNPRRTCCFSKVHHRRSAQLQGGKPLHLQLTTAQACRGRNPGTAKIPGEPQRRRRAALSVSTALHSKGRPSIGGATLSCCCTAVWLRCSQKAKRPRRRRSPACTHTVQRWWYYCCPHPERVERWRRRMSRG